MWPKLQFPTDLVTFSEEIFNGKLHFFGAVTFTMIEESYDYKLTIAQ